MSATTNPTDPIETLEGSLNSEVVRPGGESYETHRRVWNGMIDKHPRLIARCASVADVIATVDGHRGPPVGVHAGAVTAEATGMPAP